MSRLPTPEETKAKHKTLIQLEACRRDYLLMEEHHPELLGKLEQAIDDQIKYTEIRRWIREISQEDSFLQRCVNAAKFYESTLLEAR